MLEVLGDVEPAAARVPVQRKEEERDVRMWVWPSAVFEARRSAHEKEESVLVAPTTFISSAPINGLMSLARGGWWGW